MTKEQSGPALARLTMRFGPALGIDEKRLRCAVERSASEVQELASILRLNLKQSPLGQQIRRLAQSSAALDNENLQALSQVSQALRTAIDTPLPGAHHTHAHAVDASAVSSARDVASSPLREPDGSAQTPPLMRNVPVALIYADQLTPGKIVVTEKELALLRTLRNQIVLAMKSTRG